MTFQILDRGMGAGLVVAALALNPGAAMGGEGWLEGLNLVATGELERPIRPGNDRMAPASAVGVTFSRDRLYIVDDHGRFPLLMCRELEGLGDCGDLNYFDRSVRPADTIFYRGGTLILDQATGSLARPAPGERGADSEVVEPLLSFSLEGGAVDAATYVPKDGTFGSFWVGSADGLWKYQPPSEVESDLRPEMEMVADGSTLQAMGIDDLQGLSWLPGRGDDEWALLLLDGRDGDLVAWQPGGDIRGRARITDVERPTGIALRVDPRSGQQVLAIVGGGAVATYVRTPPPEPLLLWSHAGTERILGAAQGADGKVLVSLDNHIGEGAILGLLSPEDGSSFEPIVNTDDICGDAPTHRIESGEIALWIARRFNISLSKLRELNSDRAVDVLRPGRTLVVGDKPECGHFEGVAWDGSHFIAIGSHAGVRDGEDFTRNLGDELVARFQVEASDEGWRAVNVQLFRELRRVLATDETLGGLVSVEDDGPGAGGLEVGAATWYEREQVLMVDLKGPLEHGTNGRSSSVPILNFPDVMGGAAPELGRPAHFVLSGRSSETAMGRGIHATGRDADGTVYFVAGPVSGVVDGGAGGATEALYSLYRWADPDGPLLDEVGERITTERPRPTDLQFPACFVPRGLYFVQYDGEPHIAFLAGESSFSADTPACDGQRDDGYGTAYLVPTASLRRQ